MAKKPIAKDSNLIVVSREIFDLVSAELGVNLIDVIKSGIQRNEKAMASSKDEMHRELINHGDYLVGT